MYLKLTVSTGDTKNKLKTAKSLGYEHTKSDAEAERVRKGVTIESDSEQQDWAFFTAHIGSIFQEFRTKTMRAQLAKNLEMTLVGGFLPKGVRLAGRMQMKKMLLWKRAVTDHSGAKELERHGRTPQYCNHGTPIPTTRAPTPYLRSWILERIGVEVLYPAFVSNSLFVTRSTTIPELQHWCTPILSGPSALPISSATTMPIPT